MDILEELWYGNITPTEYSRIENNANYKEALRLVNHNQERLKATLNDEQKELLEKLLTANEEFSIIIELDCFKVGFKLGARLTIEAYT
jgi:mannose-6-phosphate isomerase class I